MFNLPEKFVIVDGYRIPADKAEEYRKTKERMEKEAEKFFKGFCEIVKKEPLLDLFRTWGCWIFFYGGTVGSNFFRSL